MLPIAAVVTDIEGTTTPIAFVHKVLFPYARARLEQAIARPDAAAIVSEVAQMVPGVPVLETLRHWMDEDAKVGPLKNLQGLIWADGYADGSLKGEIYPDVAPVLRRWVRSGLRLYVYSSGSVPAQKQLFGHSVDGDLTGHFSGFFDTRVGAKREPESYDRICIGIGVPPAEVLFLSDIEAELDAAATAGLRTCQLVRANDGTTASDRHQIAADFAEVAKIFAV
jgi:enolase-phosphatase E1